VIARKRHGFLREELFDNVQCFFQAADPSSGLIKRKTSLFIFALMPASADSQLEASIGEEIERGYLFGKYNRMAEVVIEYKCADTQGAGSIRRRHEGYEGRKLVDKVIGQQE